MIPDMPYMDMHTHILPGLDDGSSSMEQTVRMLQYAYEEGIRVIVATPHFGIRNPGFRLEEAEQVLAEVQAEADRITPGMKILLGNELFYTDGIAESLTRGEARTIGGTSYALVEFSTSDSYDRICKCVRELSWEGYIPLIAHIERYRCLEGNLSLVESLVRQGAVIQVNCRSFMNGRYDKSAQEQVGRRRGLFSRKQASTGFSLEDKTDWAQQLLNEGLVHLIASDCHDDVIRRPVYRSALEAMSEYADEDTLFRIARTNVLHLMRNERMPL